MDAESKRKEYIQRWENYRSQKLKEKSERTKNPKIALASPKVTRFSGVTKLRRQTLASFENKRNMDTRTRLSLAPYPQSGTALKGLNADRKKTRTTQNVKTVSKEQQKLTKENKPDSAATAKLVTTSKFRNVSSKTDSNFMRRKTLDPNFKKRLPKDSPVIKKEPLAVQSDNKSPNPIKKEVPLQKELKTLLMSANMGTPNTLKIPSINYKTKILQDSYQNAENMKKIKRRSVKFVTPENSPNPYSHTKLKSVDERREKMNEWLRKRGKAPVTNRHSSCFCKQQIPEHEASQLCKRTLTKKEIVMQKKKLDDEKHMVPECKQESPEKCKVQEDNDEKNLKMETLEETSEELGETDQLDSVIQECSILLDAGCPSSNILHWLKEIEERLPAATKSAEFWLIKARVHAVGKDMDGLLEVFSNAMKHEATPINIIADSMPQMIKDVMASSNEDENVEISAPEEELLNSDDMSDDGSIYTPSQSPVGMDSIFEYDVDVGYQTPVPPTTPGFMKHTDASSIKYSVKKTTPFKKRGNNHEDSAVIATPVRRSNRKSIARKSLGENVINSLDELTLSDKKNLLLKSNAALKDFS